MDPTEDKPDVHLVTPDPTKASIVLNLQVADIEVIHEDWSAKGANFLTPPQNRGVETRAYLRDPDGYNIEVGQFTPPAGWFED